MLCADGVMGLAPSLEPTAYGEPGKCRLPAPLLSTLRHCAASQKTRAPSSPSRPLHSARSLSGSLCNEWLTGAMLLGPLPLVGRFKQGVLELLSEGLLCGQRL
mmetsp:Transcript_78435/g.155898  ORF Transcript_78435/g.155898 Transcript_78435/m.155898 type:complete len:103 (-) Transcript_78435:418-726(-)